MGWGGAREGAGRKKAEIPKKYRGIRLTDDEWAFVKDAVKKYRNGESQKAATVEEPAQEQRSTIENKELEAGLLAHLEELCQQDYRWQLEYEKYLKDESYDRYTEEEIKLQCHIIDFQKVALAPHLMKVNFSSNLKSAYTKERVAAISGGTFPGVDKDIVIKPWKAPNEIDFDKTHLRLIKISRELDLQCRKVIELKRKLDQW